MAEQLVFPLCCPGFQLEDPTFAVLELWSNEALLVRQGLPSNPVVRHVLGFGLTDGEEVAKGAVVLEFQGADPAVPPFRLLLLSQPGVLVIQLVAQTIELWVHAVVDQSSLRQGQRWGLQQLVPQFSGEGIEFVPRSRQGQERCTGDLAQQASQGRKSLQTIGQGYEIPCGCGACAGPSGEPLQIPHGSQ